MTRWRPRFRLRTLLVLTAVCGVLLAPVAVEFGRYRREEAAMRQLARWATLKLTVPPDLSKGEKTHVGFPVGHVHAVFVQREAWFGLVNRVFQVDLTGPVTLKDIQTMAQFQSMSCLNINRDTLGRPELETLGRLPALESLDLSRCQLPDDLQPLAQLRNLKSLQLHNTGVPESAVIELQQALPGLEVLDD